MLGIFEVVPFLSSWPMVPLDSGFTFTKFVRKSVDLGQEIEEVLSRVIQLAYIALIFAPSSSKYSTHFKPLG